jgi:hypothetical protein
VTCILLSGSVAPVPDPMTMIVGALSSLAIGAIAFRILRERQVP